jgi:hypothetical protein
LKRVDSKLKEISFIIKENGGGRLLIITSITGVKDLNSYFSILIKVFGSDRVATLLRQNDTQRHRFQNR